MKKELVAGFIGVIVFTIIATAIVAYNAIIGGHAVTTVENIVKYQIAINIVWGAIFGILYPKFYKSIPGKGIWKGLVYGLMIYLLSNMYEMSYVLVYGDPIYFADEILFFTGIWIFIVFGFALGYLYEKVIIK
jgi:hypothetical protein